MKQSVLDVLLYLFENHIEDAESPLNRDSLQQQMIDAGFPVREVMKAFDWVEALEVERPPLSGLMGKRPPSRVFHPVESSRMDAECQGFILFLENSGIIDADRRELIIDRAMALDEEEVSLEELKWVVLMVLFNEPGHEDAYAWMESLMFDQEPHLAH
jgi:Smg protein